MRVVVTGATGNVGAHVVRALAADPRVESVLGLARRRPAMVVEKTDWKVADVARTDLVPHLRGAQAVVHLAWLIQPSRDGASLRSVNVDGSERVFAAAAEAGVEAIVHASSVGAYSPGPKDRAVDESFATGGVQTSFYSRHKAEVERLLDRFEEAHPSVRVARLRPGLIFSREAASGIRRLFAGPLLPGSLLRPGLLPVIPDPGNLRFQAVHSSDVAEAYRLAVLEEGRGAYNVAAEPVLDVAVLERLLGARRLPVPAKALRAAAAITWRLRLQPTPPGWLDMGLAVPIMDVSRVRDELGWTPRHSAEEALLELLAGMREGAGDGTPPLAPDAGLRSRLAELATGVGGRSI